MTTDNARWDAAMIGRWLLEEGRFAEDLDALVETLGRKLVDSGAPVWRLRLSMRTLHPLVAAVTSLWEREEKSAQFIETAHGLEGRSTYIGSPLEIIGTTGKPLRKHLAGELTANDHKVLHELKARGATDYFGLPVFFSDGASASVVMVSDAPEGFCDADIEGFMHIASLLGPIIEVYNARRISRALADAYLGARTGRRVLEGQITRGHVEEIEAAVFFSDIRDWTGLNSRLPPEETLAVANRYFELIEESVTEHGGEVLKFIGDGVLAVFATEERLTSAREVCRNALASARLSQQKAKALDPPLGIDFGIGLHFGKVLYGNVGSKSRIDFTVLGQAVNLAARVEGLCARLDRPILLSQAVAGLLEDQAELVGEEMLKGLDRPSRIYAAPDGPT